MLELDLISRLNEIQTLNRELTENELNDIIRLIKNNPQEFIGIMKNGMPVGKNINKVLTNLPYAATSAMQNDYITPVIYYDGKEQKRKVIFIDPNEINKNNEPTKAVKMLKKIDLNNNLKVYCHSCRHFLDQFSSALNKEDNHTYILPLNKIPFSTITSSVQTQAVEEACKIVNHLTDRYQDDNKNNKKNLAMDIYGQCQGVDFASKMVGSRVGKTNRIKNADINLHFDTVQVMQDTDDIMQRIEHYDKTTNIKDIYVNQTLCRAPWHPSCKTNNLKTKAEAFIKTIKNGQSDIINRNNDEEKTKLMD